MNKIIINFAIVSCFALGATLANAGDKGSKSSSQATTAQVNYYEMYDEHGKSIKHPSGVEGVPHPSEPMENEYKGEKLEHRDPHMTLIGS